MDVILAANCKNAPKNQKVADMVYAILTNDETTIKEKYDGNSEEIKLPSFDGVEEISIDIAISHGKAASCICSFEKNGEDQYLGFFLEFRTHKAETFSSIIVTHS